MAKHPRLHLHFTPTSASCLNQVERFFGLITLRSVSVAACSPLFPNSKLPFTTTSNIAMQSPNPSSRPNHAEEILA